MSERILNADTETDGRFAYPDGLSIIYQYNMLPDSEYNTIPSYQAALSAANRAIRDAVIIHGNSDQPLGQAKFYSSGPLASKVVMLSIRPEGPGMNWKEWGYTARRYVVLHSIVVFLFRPRVDTHPFQTPTKSTISVSRIFIGCPGK